jgi:hypothetical protein
MTDTSKLVRGIATELVVALDMLQEHPGSRDDGINLETTLFEISKTAFSTLWIWNQKIGSSWFLARMQLVADKYVADKAAKTLFPGAFDKCKNPAEIFAIVLDASGLAKRYNDLSAADRKALIS